MYNNTNAHSCNHYWSGKANSTTYYEHVFVASGNQHTMCMLHIVICDLSSSTTTTTTTTKKKNHTHSYWT